MATFGVCWALVVPAFMAPDEIQHYSYVETLAERHALPGAQNAPDAGVDQATGPKIGNIVNAPRTRGTNAASSALVDTLNKMNGSGVTVGLAKPEQSRLAFERWREQADQHPASDGGGVFPGSSYPPGYYAFEAIGYSLAIGGTVIDHLYAARLWSVICLLLTTIGVWCFVGQLTGGRRQMQLLGAAAVGLWPMINFLSASVNPDALLYATWTWVLWAMAVIVMEGLTARRLVVLLLLAGAAVLTKETSVALALPLAYVIGLGFWRLRGGGRAVWRPPAVVLVLLVGVPIAGLIAISALSGRPLLSQVTNSVAGFGDLREFASYVWEYYLPRLRGQTLHDYYIPSVSSYPAYNVWVASAWGAFGWVTVYFPRGAYPWFLGITILVGAAGISRAVLIGWTRRHTPWLRERGLPLVITFGLATIALMGGLHLTEFQLRSPTNQGRYLFPLAALAGTCLALASLWIPARARVHGTAVIIGALAVFELFALGYVTANYYA